MSDIDELLRLDNRVHQAFEKPSGNGLSLKEWCQQNLHRWRGRRRRAAIALLNLSGWAAMRAADRILRGVGS